MSYRIESWYAKHTGGTKFYQVIRVVSEVDDCSFHIEHYGKENLFIGLSKASTGSVTVQPTIQGQLAGQVKIREKKGRGYTQTEQQHTDNFATRADLVAGLKRRLSSPAMTGARNIINQAFKAEAPFTAPARPTVVPAQGMLATDDDYGTW